MNQADTQRSPAAFTIESPRTGSTRQQLMAAMIGNVLEYYDFIVYAFLASTLARNFFQKFFCMCSIFVAKNFDLGPREPRAIDNAGVVQFVGNNELFFAQDGRNRARIRRKAGLKHHASFRVLKTRDLLFQLHVDRHGPADGTHRSRPYSVFLGRRNRRLAAKALYTRAAAVSSLGKSFLTP